MPPPVPQEDAAAAPASAETTPIADRADLAGSWQGSISVMGMELEIIVDFVRKGDALTGVIDIPQQGAMDLPLHDIRFEAPDVYFAMLEGPQEAVFGGTLEDGVISGVFRQSGVEGSFTLTAVDATAEAATPAPDEVYTDPAGLFSVPVPTNWILETFDTYAMLTAPDGDLTVHVMAVPAESAEAGIEVAWQMVDPSFDLEQQDSTSVPPTRGIEETVSISYETDDDDRIVIAGGDLYQGIVYVMLVQSDLSTFQRRVSQVQIVGTGYDIFALEDEDLTGSDPVLFDEQLLAELEDYIVAKMTQLEIPGAAISIVRDGEVVYSQGFGTRGPDSDEPITPQTHFMIGSTGKTMTTMLMATLVDAGLMDWDTPVIEILPEFAVADPELTQQLTVRNLVCACTGVPRRDLEMIFNGGQSAEAVVEELESYEFFTDFGEAFQYSNQMVATGGYVAAAAAGGEWGNLSDAYAQVLAERITGPVGMENTTLSFDEVMARDNYAVPHGLSLAAEYYPLEMAVEKLLLPVAPAGAHWSTAEDMAAYLITQMNAGVAPNGERIVSAEPLRNTWQPQVQMTANSSYGLGWIVGEYKGVRMLRHNGNTFGFTSELAFLPDAGVGIVVLTNARATNIFNEAVRFRLLEMVYDQPYEIEEQVQFNWAQILKQAQDQAAMLGEVVALDTVAPFLGDWRNDALGPVTLYLDGETLLLDTGDFTSEVRPFAVADADAGRHVLFHMPLAGLSVHLGSDDDGSRQIVLGSGVAEYVFTRID
ncbi:MAG: beta-lactamase family protein [Caldilineaceae bacterium]|nr:beta-lactamase family protein [Caldilineaceae bacterium]